MWGREDTSNGSIARWGSLSYVASCICYFVHIFLRAAAAAAASLDGVWFKDGDGHASPDAGVFAAKFLSGFND